MRDEAFYDWLQKEKHLSQKSARDVLSRLKRVKNYVDFSGKGSDEELLFKMSQNSDFQKLTMSVKSQLRRAIHLAKKYEAEHNKN